jgi:hypothetical protein
MVCRLCLNYRGTTTCVVSSRAACTESAEEPITVQRDRTACAGQRATGRTDLRASLRRLRAPGLLRLGHLRSGGRALRPRHGFVHFCRSGFQPPVAGLWLPGAASTTCPSLRLGTLEAHVSEVLQRMEPASGRPISDVWLHRLHTGPDPHSYRPEPRRHPG